MGDPLAIRGLKRFVADNADDHRWDRTSAIQQTGKRVAIIGSGPAGLTAGYYLARCGHLVKIFEGQSEPGGMLRLCVPEYRLPKELIDREIARIQESGVEIQTNVKISSLTSLMADGYDAALIAVGAGRGAKLNIEGSDLVGVEVATSFLANLTGQTLVTSGDTIVVLGGGNVAIDCARTALRLGAKEIHMICLEAVNEMVASPEEIDQCREEGIMIHNSLSCTKIIGKNSKVGGVECVAVCSFKFNDDGKATIECDWESKTFFPADKVIFSVGQLPELDFISDLQEIRVSKKAVLEIDTQTMSVGYQGVFAAGDVLTGTKSVVEAIESGRQAAIAIDRYLGGRGIPESTIDFVMAEETEEERKSLKFQREAHPEFLPANARQNSFSLVEVSFGSEKEVIEEAKRCLRADLPIYYDSRLCAQCHACELACSMVTEGTFNISKAKLKLLGEKDESPEYKIVFLDSCINCGFCVTVCPYGALTH
jgi:NADPH-dependent glutamate synthase beta subunit-like oxidoreductase/NAD-dependent dihydropyrimidine dehydrogenase PreA subunit